MPVWRFSAGGLTGNIFSGNRSAGGYLERLSTYSTAPTPSSMLVLYETAAGYALFKLVDDGKLEKPDDIWKHFETAEKANQT